MDGSDELFDWTGHNFDVVPKGRPTVLVSVDYQAGAVVHDISDPTDATATGRYETDDEADGANDPILGLGGAPMPWGANFADERDVTVVGDMFPGLYVDKITPGPSS